MNPTQALQAARAAGVHLAVEGVDLLLEAPAPPPLAVLDALARHKASIVKLLQPMESLRSDFAEALADLERECPVCIEPLRWQKCIADARGFLMQWGEQAHALGWTVEELFGLHEPPTNPHPSYQRLSRYDATGLLWLLKGYPVIAISERTASIRSPTGATTIYRKHNKPAYGPLGDCLDDLSKQ